MATAQTLYEDYRSGDTYRQIAERYGLNADSVRGRIWRYLHSRVERDGSAPPFDAVPLPKYTTVPTLRQPVVVLADIHTPATDWYMLELAARFGEKHLPKGERVAVIVGDLVNFDILSVYEHILPVPTLQTELAYARDTLKFLLTVYDKIFYGMGNHDMRLHKKLEGSFGATELGHLLYNSLYDGRLITTNRTQFIVVQDGHIWRLTHQRNFSRNKGIVAAQLALKHECNVITAHEHHVAITRDPYNRYTVINNGALVDYERLGYVMVVDSTSPVMNAGFSFLQNGVGHLLTPYPTMTDWDRWGLSGAAAAAIAEADNKRRRLSLPGDELQVIERSAAA